MKENNKANEKTEVEENVEEKETLEKKQDDKAKKKTSGDIKKIAKLEKALTKAEEERDAFKDSYQRTFSEFNNFKKRNQSATCQAVQDGMGEAVEKMLPVLDNFERALEHADEHKGPFTDGVVMVYKQFAEILTGMEVSEIPAMGEPFDPNVHQAIQQVEAEEGTAPDTVVGVVQKGYEMCGKIIRHSMVIVSK